MPKLDESLINDLEADIRGGLLDSKLREKHDISESTWRGWKHRGVIDRSKGLKTSHTMLLDRLQEGREAVKQIENILDEMVLGVGLPVSTTTYKDKSGEITKIKNPTTNRPSKFQFKACEFSLRCNDPENWNK